MKILVLAAMIGTALIGAANAEVGVWTVRSKTNVWTDQSERWALVHTADGSVVVIACGEGEISAQVRIGRYDGSPYATRKVRWRVDYKTPYNETWRQLDADRGVIIEGYAALEFADMVSRANTRLVFMTSGGTRTFEVQGSETAIGEVMAMCGKD